MGSKTQNKVIRIRENPHITYEQFGAWGDGIHDDTIAIHDAHEYANEHNLPVVVRNGATYLIETAETANVKTDCVWDGAIFYIDDRTASVKQAPRCPVFTVHASHDEYDGDRRLMTQLIKTNDRHTPYKNATLYMQDHSQVHFRRFGECANPGVAATVVVSTNEDGYIQQLIQPKLNRVDNFIVYPGEEEDLLLYGGTFVTIANDELPYYKYYQRGIKITRSNVIVELLGHQVIKEGLTSAPYESFITIGSCKNVELRDINIQARRFYYEGAIHGERQGDPMGTYEIQINQAVNITLDNVLQTNFDKDLQKLTWGPIATNYCNMMVIRNCILDRFDAHNGISNIGIFNTTIGWQGIKLTGWGACYIDRCRITDINFVVLRYDYGSFWDGNIVIKDCEWTWPNGDLVKPAIISALNYGFHNFGYPCMGPHKVTIINLKKQGPCYVFSDYNDDPEEDQPYPYIPTAELELIGHGHDDFDICPDESKYKDLVIRYPDK